MIKIQRSGCLLIAISLLVVSAAGCATPPRYRWGIYEELIYQSYKNPEGTDPVSQAARLSADIERTTAEGLAVPPGVHAHLGYLYAAQGDTGLARTYLELELELYPESKIFIDGLIKRMEQQ